MVSYADMTCYVFFRFSEGGEGGTLVQALALILLNGLGSSGLSPGGA